MSDQKFTPSRRTFLKGAAYSSALTLGGLSGIAMAGSAVSKRATEGYALPTCDISIMRQHTLGKEIVSLFNHTDKVVTLNSITPVGLEHINGSLLVKVNQIDDHTSNKVIKLKAGERLSFEVEAITKNNSTESLPIPNVLAGHLKITSDHPAFNGIVPVTVFDSQVA